MTFVSSRRLEAPPSSKDNASPGSCATVSFLSVSNGTQQTLLEMYNTTVNRYHTEYQILLDRARDCFGYLVSQPPIQISADSPVHAAFDPYISRRLSTNVPVRVIPLMPEKDVWDGLGKLLESLQETKTLVLCHHPRTWEVSL